MRGKIPMANGTVRVERNSFARQVQETRARHSMQFLDVEWYCAAGQERWVKLNGWIPVVWALERSDKLLAMTLLKSAPEKIGIGQIAIFDHQGKYRYIIQAVPSDWEKDVAQQLMPIFDAFVDDVLTGAEARRKDLEGTRRHEMGGA